MKTSTFIISTVTIALSTAMPQAKGEAILESEYAKVRKGLAICMDQERKENPTKKDQQSLERNKVLVPDHIRALSICSAKIKLNDVPLNEIKFFQCEKEAFEAFGLKLSLLTEETFPEAGKEFDGQLKKCFTDFVKDDAPYGHERHEDTGGE